ncbi:hypothetical protein AKJ16_DCAP00792 [Drosera capensis]
MQSKPFIHVVRNNCDCQKGKMKFLDWYAKIAVVSALVDDKVTALESEKRAWENSPEAQAVKEALNPWRVHYSEVKENA